MKTTKHRHGHRWSTEEVRRLMVLWEDESKTAAEVAAELGATESACNRMVRRLRAEGVPLRRRRQGHKPFRACKLWTQEEIEFLFRRRLAGATVDDIAGELGRSFSAVQGMIHQLRTEGVPVAMRGNGVRRLWDANALKAAAASRFDEQSVALAEAN